MIEREEIINFLKEYSKDKEYVYAMWLEGADGINKVDEYSDIDFWFDVDEEKMTTFLYECIEQLQQLGKIDSRVDEIREEIAQSNIHLQNTSKYLTLDICVQSHNREKSATCYIKNDIAELPLIIFDKDNVITFEDKYELDVNLIKEVFENNKNRIKQKSRVEKYIRRNQYLEAYMKYIEDIAEPLVVIARLIYTPEHYDYKLCHITDHLPKEEVERLERFFKVSNFKEIEKNIKIAESLLNEYEEMIHKEYFM